MKKADMVFINIDTQNDFLDSKGSLYIPGSESIRPNLSKLVNFAVNNNITIISTMDSHSKDDPEFQEFNSHCISGTWGWQNIPETVFNDFQTIEYTEIPDLELKSNRFVVLKQKINVFSNPNIRQLIEKLKKRDFIVFGVATDYCVKQVVLGLLNAGFNVLLVEDAIKGINEDDAQSAIQEFLKKGVKLVKTEDIIKSLSD